MPEKRRKFEKDFKDGVVDIVLTTGRAVAEVAREIGVHEGTLGNWVELRRRSQKPGAAMSHPVVREARKGDHQAPHRDRSRAHPRPVECSRGERQHQAATAHSHRVRVPLTRRPHRPRHARPRRALSTPSRPRHPMKSPTDGAQEPQIYTGSAPSLSRSHGSLHDAAEFASCCGPASRSTPLRTRPLDRTRGPHYRDHGVSPDRTLTGGLPRACHPVTSCPLLCSHGARTAGRSWIEAETFWPLSQH